MAKENELIRTLPTYGRGFSFQTPHERRMWWRKLDAVYGPPKIRKLSPKVTELFLVDLSDPFKPQTITHRLNGQDPKQQS